MGVREAEHHERRVLYGKNADEERAICGWILLNFAFFLQNSADCFRSRRGC